MIRTPRVSDQSAGYTGAVRTMFWLYLVFVVCGLALYTVVGLGHY
jgi:hypothetical protein